MTSYEKFRGNKLSRWTTFKRFPGNKKRRKSKFVRSNIRFYCTVIKVGHLTYVKIAKKEFQKTCFPLFFLSWVLNFWNFTNATIIWYHNYKSVVFFRIFADDDFFIKFRGKKLSRMKSFEKFRGNKLSRIWLKTAKPRKFLPAKVSSFKVSSRVFTYLPILDAIHIVHKNELCTVDNFYARNFFYRLWLNTIKDN